MAEQKPDLTVRDLVERLGRTSISERTGASKQSIANYVAEGRFPARWFGVLRAMAEEVGVANSGYVERVAFRKLFNFLEDRSESENANERQSEDAA